LILLTKHTFIVT